MRRAKLNTHTDASGNLCARSPNRVKRRNGWHEISGASACRCRSCWPRPMYGTPRWFLGLENGLINALHIVDDQCWKRKNTWLHKWSILWLWYYTSTHDRKSRHLSYNWSIQGLYWMMFFVWKISWSYCEIRTHCISSFSSHILCLFRVLPLSSSYSLSFIFPSRNLHDLSLSFSSFFTSFSNFMSLLPLLTLPLLPHNNLSLILPQSYSIKADTFVSSGSITTALFGENVWLFWSLH